MTDSNGSRFDPSHSVFCDGLDFGLRSLELFAGNCRPHCRIRQSSVTPHSHARTATYQTGGQLRCAPTPPYCAQSPGGTRLRSIFG